MKSVKSSIIVACVVALVAVGGSYAGDGFKFPNLNPFSGNSKKTTNNSFDLVKKKPKPAPQKPGLYKQMTSSTSKAVSSTTDMLNPFSKKKKMPARRPPITGSQRVVRGSSMTNQAADKKGNWFTNLFSSKPEPEAPRTALDFLQQDRVY